MIQYFDHPEVQKYYVRSFVFYDLFGGIKESGKSIFSFFDWDLVLRVGKEGGVYTLNKKSAGVDPFLINTNKVKITKKEFSLLLKKPNTKKVVVFYQNQKRKISSNYFKNNRVVSKRAACFSGYYISRRV